MSEVVKIVLLPLLGLGLMLIPLVLQSREQARSEDEASRSETVISSLFTPLVKFAAPPYLVFFLASYLWGGDSTHAGPVILVAVMLAAATVEAIKVKKVTLQGHTLLVSSYFSSYRVAVENITAIKWWPWILVVVVRYEVGGTKKSFWYVPTGLWVSDQPHPTVERINKLRGHLPPS